MANLRTFGTIELSGYPACDTLLAQTKRLALFVYLATARPRGFHRRDRLVGLFWPEHSSEHARAALRKSLHAIRQALGEQAIVNRGDEEIAVSESLGCDAQQFEEAISAGRFAAALEIYRGEFSAGLFADAPGFERWAELERAYYRDAASTAAWTLAERYSTSADLTSATRWARRAVFLAPTDERRLRRALSLLQAAGDRAGAVQLYEEFARRLREDLEVTPSPETLSLVRSIRGAS